MRWTQESLLKWDSDSLLGKGLFRMNCPPTCNSWSTRMVCCLICHGGCGFNYMMCTKLLQTWSFSLLITPHILLHWNAMSYNRHHIYIYIYVYFFWSYNISICAHVTRLSLTSKRSTSRGQARWCSCAAGCRAVRSAESLAILVANTHGFPVGHITYIYAFDALSTIYQKTSMFLAPSNGKQTAFSSPAAPAALTGGCAFLAHLPVPESLATCSGQTARQTEHSAFVAQRPVHINPSGKQAPNSTLVNVSNHLPF